MHSQRVNTIHKKKPKNKEREKREKNRKKFFLSFLFLLRRLKSRINNVRFDASFVSWRTRAALETAVTDAAGRIDAARGRTRASAVRARKLTTIEREEREREEEVRVSEREETETKKQEKSQLFSSSFLFF
jgi:hypothetical protein